MNRNPGSSDARGASLTKPNRPCKASLALTVLLSFGNTSAVDRAAQADLRDCVATAQDAAAVTACEVTQQAALKARIGRWSAGIRKRLDSRQRQLFERNAKAWQTFVDSETAMLELTLDMRGDGLGAKLRPGAVTRLYEERERQLREHLHNLTHARGR